MTPFFSIKVSWMLLFYGHRVWHFSEMPGLSAFLLWNLPFCCSWALVFCLPPLVRPAGSCLLSSPALPYRGSSLGYSACSLHCSMGAGDRPFPTCSSLSCGSAACSSASLSGRLTKAHSGVLVSYCDPPKEL